MNELMQQGLQLMVLGMGVVFLFLGLLIGVISLTSKVIQRFESAPAEARASSITTDTNLVEVITEAVKQYRSDHPHRKQ